MACKSSKEAGPKGKYAVWCWGHAPLFCDVLEEARARVRAHGSRGRCLIEHGSTVFSGRSRRLAGCGCMDKRRKP